MAPQSPICQTQIYNTGESVSAVNVVCSSKDVNAWQESLSAFIESCKSLPVLFNKNSSNKDFSEEHILQISNVLQTLKIGSDKLLVSGFYTAIDNLRLLEMDCKAAPELLQQYNSNVVPSILADRKAFAYALEQQKQLIEIVSSLLGGMHNLLSSYTSNHSHLASLLEAMNRTSHVERQVLHNSDDCKASNNANQTAEDSEQNNESSSTPAVLNTNSNHGSTTKHRTARDELYEQHKKSITAQIENNKELVQQLSSQLQEIQLEVVKKIDSDANASADKYLAEVGVKVTYLEEQIAALKQDIEEDKQQLAKLQEADSHKSQHSKFANGRKKAVHRPFGECLEVGNQLSLKKWSAKHTQDGIYINASGQVLAKYRGAQLYYVAARKRLELKSSVNPYTKQQESTLVTSPCPPMVSFWYQVNLFVPNEPVGKRWFGRFSDILSAPEELLPISPARKTSIGELTYYFNMLMSGVPHYTLRKLANNFGKSAPNEADEGHSSFSTALTEFDELVLSPIFDGFIAFAQQCVSINVYADETVSIVNETQGKGHISQAAFNKFQQGDYADIPSKQYAMVVRCECFQEDGSVFNLVLFRYIGSRSTECIQDFLNEILGSKVCQAKVNFLFTDGYQAYAKIAKELDCDWGMCLVHAYRKFTAAFHSYFTLIEQKNKATTFEERVNLQAQLSNMLSLKVVKIGITMMDYIQTILCLDSGIVSEIDELFPNEKRGSPEYIEALHSKRSVFRKESIVPYFKELKHCCDMYNQLIEQDSNVSKVSPMLSGLHKAVNYLVNHWNQITKFTANTAMYCNNNGCEQSIKHAILPMKMRRQNFQTKLGSKCFFDLQSNWLTLKANNVDPNNFFTRVNHITCMSLFSLYLRSRVVEDKPISKRGLYSCKFKKYVVENLYYEGIVRTFLKNKSLTDQELNDYIAMVVTTPFVKSDGKMLALFNQEKYQKRQVTMAKNKGSQQAP